MRVFDTIYVGGAWRTPLSDEVDLVEDPATEQSIASVPSCGASDVDIAVAAAARAFDGWSRTSASDRAGFLARIRDGIVARTSDLAETITAELGAPLALSRNLHVGLPTTVTGSYVDLLADYEFGEAVGNSLVVREPVGVVAAITPWNYPLHQVMAKVAAALAAGCTVVLKPSELTPVTAYLLAEIVHEVGLPPGVFNLVPGRGPIVGEALASHPEVDMVSFTGSTRAGRRVAELASRTVKRVALELGGKSANVILPDADLGRAVANGVGNAFLNGGQTCSAWTRMLVHRDSYDEAVELAVRAAERQKVGDPRDKATRLGPVVSGSQRDTIRGYIRKGIDDGARLVTGGIEPPDGLDVGYYVRPTVLANVRPDAVVAQEEIFGPVLSIIRYHDDEEALRIANDSAYGLAGGVWSADEERAVNFARRMRTGQVDINGGSFNPLAPFGGYKQSGNSRELGRHGLEEFLQPKAIQF